MNRNFKGFIKDQGEKERQIWSRDLEETILPGIVSIITKLKAVLSSHKDFDKTLSTLREKYKELKDLSKITTPSNSYKQRTLLTDILKLINDWAEISHIYVNVTIEWEGRHYGQAKIPTKFVFHSGGKDVTEELQWG